MNTTGTGWVYGTYLGGSGTDVGRAITLKNGNEAMVTGETNSTENDVNPFPIYLASQKTIGGGYDAFLTWLDQAGAAWKKSTYVGGNDNDYGRGIVIGSSGVAYVDGFTKSTNLLTVTPQNTGYQQTVLCAISSHSNAENRRENEGSEQ